MSELLETFSLEDPMTSTAEQGSSTDSLPDFDMDMDFDIDSLDLPADLSDIPTGGMDLSTPSLDLSVSDLDSNFNPDTGLFNSGPSFNSFDSQFAPPPMMPQQFMPMYTPQYPFGYMPPPGYMLVPAFYSQQPMMPMMQPPMQMPMQNPSFSFTPTPDVPAFPSFDLDSSEPMSDVSVSTSARRSHRNAGKKTTYEDTPTPSPTPTPVKRQKISRPKIQRPAIDLAGPISVLTDGCDAPIKDMLAIANRSAAVRRADAKKAGKILRPLNSFVCYRAAYADRVKQWASKNSHQDLSIILGQSWKIEPKNIRDFYINCAELDRANHNEAFPHYKFNPGKPGKSGASKKSARSVRTASPGSDDEPTPRPNKTQQLVPLPLTDEDDEMTSLFGDSPAPTPSKYNFRRRL
ncbi:unnamed protein product [Aureobasidium uvarum]|uniref:HMG box domain-containing protein n=1 Tax=Aureobasidium uvarum TaxID=2773716 RepID=A0A9N8KIM0_9PEZI|nr:unnamed protein product [Aureobasidium uvarum]